MLQRLLSALSPASKLNAQRQRLYGLVVAQARSSELYSALGVPDTFDGRLSMMILHLYPIHRRLRLDGEKKSAQLSQGLFDAFFDDMDAALREAAVGDQAVPKRLAKVTRVFYGHAKTLDQIMDGPSDAAGGSLQEFLKGNLIDTEQTTHVDGLASYLLDSYRTIDSQPVADLLSAGPKYAPIIAHARSI